MNEVGSALIAIALVLCAVFVPSVFITGISGQFYRQFALTIAGATVISLIVSLTLSPAMCALLLKPHDPTHRDRWWERPIHALLRRLQLGFRRRRCRDFLAGHAHRAPRRDHVRDLSRRPRLRPQCNSARRRSASSRRSTAATSSLVVQLPPGASLARTDAVQQRALDIALEVPGVAHGVNIVGFSGATFTNAPNSGAIFLVLDPFEKRAQRSGAIGARPSRPSSTAGCRKSRTPSSSRCCRRRCSGIGTAGGFRMMIEDRAGRGSAALQQAAVAMMARATQTPGVAQVFTLFETSTPQVYLDIDRTKAQLLGINVQDVFNALQVYLGSAYVNDFNLFGRTFRVTAQARDEDRQQHRRRAQDPRAQFSSGDTVPLGSFTTVRDISGPYRVPRYNLYPRCRARWRRRARLFAGPGDRDHGEARGRDAARRLRHRVDDARLPADPRRQHRDVRLRAGGGVRLPGAGRAVRKPDACRSP